MANIIEDARLLVQNSSYFKPFSVGHGDVAIRLPMSLLSRALFRIRVAFGLRCYLRGFQMLVSMPRKI